MASAGHFQLLVACDDATHAEGDRTAERTFFGPDRESAIASAERAGWVVTSPSNATLCPRHARAASRDSETSESGGAINDVGSSGLRKLSSDPRGYFRQRLAGYARERRGARERSRLARGLTQEEREIASQAAAFVSGWLEGLPVLPQVDEVAATPAGPWTIVRFGGDFGDAIGRLYVLSTRRAFDHVAPPGTVPVPYGTEHSILVHETLVGPRHPIRRHVYGVLEPRDHNGTLMSWIGRRAIEWHIEDPDIWSAVFANPANEPWWAEVETASPEVEALAGLCLRTLAAALADHRVSRRR